MLRPEVSRRTFGPFSFPGVRYTSIYLQRWKYEAINRRMPNKLPTTPSNARRALPWNAASPNNPNSFVGTWYTTKISSPIGSDRDPLDNIPGHRLVPAIIKSCCSWVGVTGEVLHVFERDALCEQIGDRCDSKRVRRQARWKATGE
jgi:hypothetical protein